MARASHPVSLRSAIAFPAQSRSVLVTHASSVLPVIVIEDETAYVAAYAFDIV